VVVRAYIDESVGKYKTFALGCVIAKGTEWTWISRDWKKCKEGLQRLRLGNLLTERETMPGIALFQSAISRMKVQKQ
jgi:hypothetical protein